MTADGLHVEVEKGRGDNKTRGNECVSAPFEILGACRDPQGRGWGKYLRWRDGDGRAHVQHVTDAALQGDPGPVCGSLVDGGLQINRAQQRFFANYLSGVSVAGRVTIILRTGWHEVGGRSVFVLPGATIGPRGSETVILDGAAHGPYEDRGMLKDWQAGVGRLASGQVLPVLAISAALAGPRCIWRGRKGAASIFKGHRAGARRRSCKPPRPYGGEAARPAM